MTPGSGVLGRVGALYRPIVKETPQQDQKSQSLETKCLGKNKSLTKTYIVVTQEEQSSKRQSWDTNKVTQRCILLRKSRQGCEKCSSPNSRPGTHGDEKQLSQNILEGKQWKFTLCEAEAVQRLEWG